MAEKLEPQTTQPERKAWEPNPRTSPINRTFHEYLESGYQYGAGGNRPLEERQTAFKEKIMGDPDVTKADLVEWITERAPGWYRDAQTAHEDWVRNAD